MSIVGSLSARNDLDLLAVRKVQGLPAETLDHAVVVPLAVVWFLDLVTFVALLRHHLESHEQRLVAFSGHV